MFDQIRPAVIYKSLDSTRPAGRPDLWVHHSRKESSGEVSVDYCVTYVAAFVPRHHELICDEIYGGSVNHHKMI